MRCSQQQSKLAPGSCCVSAKTVEKPEGESLANLGMEKDNVEVRPRERAAAVLKECFGSGWTTLKISVMQDVESFTKRSVGGNAEWIGR